MSKYIIELGEDANMVQVISVTQSGNAYIDSTVYVGYIEQLTADYINENFGELQDQAYQKGLEDVWEAAKKLFSTMAESDIERAFPIEWNSGGFKALMNLHPQQAIERLKAYEEKRKAEVPIMAGDEVKAEDGTVVFIVTWMSDRCICGVDKEGKCYSYEPKEICGKTGRHFDIILEEKKA